VNDQILTGNSFKLIGGQYEIYYQPTNNYIEHYSEDTAAATIMADQQLVQQIDRIDSVLDFFKNDPDAVQGGLGKMSLTKLNTLLPFINIDTDHLVKINDLLTSTPLSSERQFMKER
jgi:alpha-L-rhamnosidase